MKPPAPHLEVYRVPRCREELGIVKEVRAVVRSDPSVPGAREKHHERKRQREAYGRKAQEEKQQPQAPRGPPPRIRRVNDVLKPLHLGLEVSDLPLQVLKLVFGVLWQHISNHQSLRQQQQQRRRQQRQQGLESGAEAAQKQEAAPSLSSSSLM